MSKLPFSDFKLIAKTSSMKRADHRFNLPQNPGMANQILRYYNLNQSSFEHVPPKPDHKLLIAPGTNISDALLFQQLQMLSNEISNKNERILIIINHFRPLLNITEALLHKASEVQYISRTNHTLNMLRESLNKEYTWEIQRCCRALVDELELHIDDLIDKGFILRILIDYRLLMGKLKSYETELADLVHQYDAISNEYSVKKTMLESQFIRSESH